MSVTQSHGKVSLAKSPKFNPVNSIFACWTIEYQYCYISYLPNLVLSFVLYSDGEASIPTGGAGPTSGGNVLLNRRQNIWQMRGGGGRGVSLARLTRRETFEQTKQAVNRQLCSTEKATTFSSGISKNSWSVLTKCTRYAMYSSYKVKHAYHWRGFKIPPDLHITLLHKTRTYLLHNSPLVGLIIYRSFHQLVI